MDVQTSGEKQAALPLNKCREGGPVELLRAPAWGAEPARPLPRLKGRQFRLVFKCLT